jgi:histidinol-phosphate aminotransferase
MEPYVPGKPLAELERELGIVDAIKLASNENPLGPSPLAVEAARRALKDIALYPDGSGFALRQALGARLQVDPAQITLGNGSNDVLVLLAETFLTPDTEAVYSEFAFLVYPLAVQATGAAARVAPALPPGGPQPLGHNLAAMRALIGPRTRLVFIANPNNPTGTWLERRLLRIFLEGVPADVIVVVDEAYCEYSSGGEFPETLPWLADFPNLVITRTFSKIHGLAGLRVGYAVSHREIAGLLNRVRQPFNVNSLAQEAAIAALADEPHVTRSREANARGRVQLAEGLRALGIDCIPSAGNFVLADLRRLAAPVYDHLLRQGIIVRPVANYGLPCHLRVTVGLAEQNERLLRCLPAALRSVGDPVA